MSCGNTSRLSPGGVASWLHSVGYGPLDEPEPDVCAACEGTGRIVVRGYDYRCEVCRGEGRVVETPEEHKHNFQFEMQQRDGFRNLRCECNANMLDYSAILDERVRQLEAALDEAYEAMTELADLTTNPMLRDSLKAAANEVALVRGLANTQPVEEVNHD